MRSQEYTHKIDQLQQRLQNLKALARKSAPAEDGVMTDALIHELSTALEELHVTEEELRQQHEALLATQETVVAERQRYQELFEFAPDAYLVTDATGKIQAANRAAVSLLDVERTQMIGIVLTVFVAKNSLKAYHRKLTQIEEAGRVQGWELQLQPRNGPAFPASVTVEAISDEESQVTTLRWLIRDITERKRVEQELQENKAFLQTVYTGAGISIWAIDVTEEGEFFFAGVNPTAAGILGRPAESIVGKRIDQLSPAIPAESVARMRARYRRCVKAGEAIEFETAFPQQDEVAWWLLRLEPLHDERGRAYRIIGTGLPITERKQMEETLRESEMRFRTIFEQAAQGIALYQAGKLVACNAAMQKMLGYTQEELREMKYTDFTHPDDLDRSREQHQELVAGRCRQFTMEKRYLHCDGHVIWGRVTVSALETGQGDQRMTIALVDDVTERKRVEDALRESEARFRAMFERTALGVSLADLDGRIVKANPALQQLLGYSADEIHGMNFADFTHPDDLDTNLEERARLIAGEQGHFTLEKRYVRKDGRVIWVDLTVSLVRDAAGEPTFTIGMIQDITAQKRLEVELATVKRKLAESRETERLSLAQQLHDGPIQNLYGVTFRLGALSDSLKDQVSSARMVAARASVQQVLRELREISNELRPATWKSFGLRGALRSHVKRLQTAHPELDIRLEFDDIDQGDMPEQIQLVLYRICEQLLHNVVRHAGASEVVVRLKPNPHNLLLEVEDNGGGFSPPHHWSELAREGHLGLADASERAEAAGGYLNIMSRPGDGALVQVVVPYSNQTDEA